VAAAAAPSLAQSASAIPETDPANAPTGDLVDLFPAALDGQDLEVSEFDGAEWLAQFDAADPDDATMIERTEALLTSLDGSLDDLSVATASHAPGDGNVATIAAMRVLGNKGHEIIPGAIGLMLGEVAFPDLEVRFNGGRDVLKVRDVDMPGAYPRTLVAIGDTLWILEAEPPLLDEILAALPPAPDAATPVFDLAASVPFELDGNRRVYLVVSSGWDYVYWLSENYPSQLDVIALESFLASGIAIKDVTTTSSIWTDPDGNIGAVLAAYQFAGADEAVLEKLLQEVILPGFGGFGSEYEAGQIAGRDVTLLLDQTLTEEDGTPRPVYLYVSGDTVFVLDAPEETTRAAIETLP
jgi:hypothetical protein